MPGDKKVSNEQKKVRRGAVKLTIQGEIQVCHSSNMLFFQTHKKKHGMTNNVEWDTQTEGGDRSPTGAGSTHRILYLGAMEELR